MDNFEKYIRKNQDEFNEHKADKDKLWANIEAKLDANRATPVKKVKIIKIWRSSYAKIAAIFILAIGVFSLINFGLFYNDSSNNAIANQELNDIDMHYQSLVAYQVKLVNKSSQLSLDEKKEFLSFMDELDEEYNTLKIELFKNVDSERVLEAIVLNYKKRIEIIENLLNLINDSKKMKDDHEYIL